jgi:Cu/Ag efflux protein CusF
MKERTMQTWVVASGLALIIIGASIAVSVPREVFAGSPCCNITSVDKKTGIVTAKDTATGETIEFRLGDAAKIRNIKIGDQVSADSQTREVTVHSFQPVDGILIRKPMPPPPKK